MHGVVLCGLRDFVRKHEDREAWEALKDRADVDRVVYSRTDDYPREEFEQLFDVLIDEHDLDRVQFEREFGRYVFEDMVELYGRIYFDDEWGAIDMLHNIKDRLHQSFEQRSGMEFTPPALETDRIGDDRVVVIFDSDRRLCDLARGLIDGVADYYDTTLEIDEPECTRNGAQRCRMAVTRKSETEASESVPDPETRKGHV